MPCVGFEPMIPASERAKIVHALERSSAVTCWDSFTSYLYHLILYNLRY
jgi:hypothetical protein